MHERDARVNDRNTLLNKVFYALNGFKNLVVADKICQPEIHQKQLYLFNGNP